MTLTIHGTVAAGFEPVADVFRQNFLERGEVGAAVAAWRGDELVVDLWAGEADVATHRPWERDTLAVMFSATKGLVATGFLMLEDRGQVDLDRPVAFYWPEFGRDGKERITVRDLLNHRSGLCAVDETLTLADFRHHRRVEGALVRQRPLWEPGTDQGYGATAWGMYTQALFRRLAGETLGSWLRREVFEPLDADLFLGLPAGEDARVATLYPVPTSEMIRVVLPKVWENETLEGRCYRRLLTEPSSATARAFLNPKLGRARLNSLNEPEIRALELPWMNGIGTARGLARVYAALASGTRIGRRALVRRSAVERVAAKQSWAYSDRVLVKPLGYSQGFAKEEPHLISPHETSFGHTGAGGTVGFADPKHGVGFAYLMNRMDHHIRSPRCIQLCRSLYRSLDGFT